MGKAVTEARKEVEGLRDAAAALGMGPGQPGSNDPRAIAELYKRVRNDPALRRISELAGGFRRVAASKQRRKVMHGMDDVVGVEPGGDIGRLLPSELAQLAVRNWNSIRCAGLSSIKRSVENTTPSNPWARGRSWVVVDESGSMDGAKAHTGEGTRVGAALVARQQHRWAGLIAYSGGSGERLLALPPGRWNESALCDWLSAFIGGGSDLDVPINELPRMYREIVAPPGVPIW